jgi:hypothetical protein
MKSDNTPNSRRRFLTQGAATLGASVAATAGAATLTPRQRPATPAEDREAIRQLHRDFMALIEQERYEAVAALFDGGGWLQLDGTCVTGGAAIAAFFTTQYRQQAADARHGAYRQQVAQPDAVQVSEDQRTATATFHVDVALNMPLRGDSTLVQMARLQGQVAQRRWESGRFDVTCVKSAEQWKLASLDYLPQAT